MLPAQGQRFLGCNWRADLRNLTRQVKYFNDAIADFELKEERIFKCAKQELDDAAHRHTISIHQGESSEQANDQAEAVNEAANFAEADRRLAMAGSDMRA